MPYSKEPVREWNTIEANKAILESYAEGNDLDVEQAKKELENDSWVWEEEYRDMTDHLTEIMNKVQLNVLGEALGGYGKWIAEASNMGWRHTSGTAHVEADTGKELLSKILPQTDNAFRIYDDGDSIRIINYHHDAPTGESYSISPIMQSEFEYNYNFDELAKDTWAIVNEIHDKLKASGKLGLFERQYEEYAERLKKFDPLSERHYQPDYRYEYSGPIDWIIGMGPDYVDGFARHLAGKGWTEKEGFDDFAGDFRFELEK